MLRKSKSHLLASALAAGGMMVALSMATASGAEAAVYDVTSDHCTNLCSPDSGDNVTVTQDGANLDFVVTLLGGDQFMHGPTGNGKSTFGFDFDLSTISISGLVAPWQTNLTANGNGSFTAGSFPMDGAGDYDYVIDYTPGSGGPTGVSTLSFTIASASLSDIPNVAGVFAADIKGFTSGNTGVVDFSLSSVVPETSTWAMMAVGFAGLGYFGLRRSKSSRAAFAA
jgi:hypothetical protein